MASRWKYPMYRINLADRLRTKYKVQDAKPPKGTCTSYNPKPWQVRYIEIRKTGRSLALTAEDAAALLEAPDKSKPKASCIGANRAKYQAQWRADNPGPKRISKPAQLTLVAVYAVAMVTAALVIAEVMP